MNLPKNKSSEYIGQIITDGIDGEVVLIGFPYDLGCKRLSSPIAFSGIDNGPDCLRRFLPKLGAIYNAEYDVCLENLKIKDYGNIHMEGSVKNLEALLEKLKAKCVNIYKRQGIPIIIGGARDTVYGPIAGVLDLKEKNVLHINMMNKLDCETLYDGSKVTAKNFLRKILLDYPNSNYKAVYFGIEDSSFSKNDLEFLKENEKYIEIITMKKIRMKEEKAEEFPNIRTQAGKFLNNILNEVKKGLFDHIHLSVSLEAINVIFPLKNAKKIQKGCILPRCE